MITGIVRGPAGGVRGGVLFRRAPVPDGFEAPLAPPPLRGERGSVRLTGGTREAPAAIATTRPLRGSVGVARKGSGPKRCIETGKTPRGMPEADRTQ